MGTVVFFIGICISIYLAVAKFAFAKFNMTERPIFYFGLASMIIGTQLFLAGFIGELISRNAPERNYYLIEKKIGI
jgi:hypothetical protein